MNDILKWLVGAACVAVVCAVGYFFWGEFREARLRAEIADRRERVRAELFDLAKAEKHDVQRVSDWCKSLDGSLDTSLAGNEMAKTLARNCRALGYL